MACGACVKGSPHSPHCARPSKTMVTHATSTAASAHDMPQTQYMGKMSIYTLHKSRLHLCWQLLISCSCREHRQWGRKLLSVATASSPSACAPCKSKTSSHISHCSDTHISWSGLFSLRYSSCIASQKGVYLVQTRPHENQSSASDTAHVCIAAGFDAGWHARWQAQPQVTVHCACARQVAALCCYCSHSH